MKVKAADCPCCHAVKDASRPPKKFRASVICFMYLAGKTMTAKVARLITTMFFGAAVAALVSSDLCAQTTKGPARVAVLNPFSPPEPGFEAFRGALRELGYVEGRNLVFEIRWAHGRLDRLPELARELVPLKPDVIFAPGEQGLRAAKEATTTTDTPIVVVACDPLDQLIKGTSNNARGRKFGLGPVFDCLPGFFSAHCFGWNTADRLHRLHAAASRSSVTRR